MAHYAFINENNIVTEVIVGKDEDDLDTLPEGFADWEEWYADFRGQTCKRTSYNTIANIHSADGTPFRGNYAGIGYTYDETNDVFYAKQPFASWLISADTNWIWEAPIKQPTLTSEQITAGAYYQWNEKAYQADNTVGWDLIT